MSLETNRIITGDCTEVLAELPESSVHMAMTSPPYWNLRDYDHADQLGLEETPEAYVQDLCDALDGVKRVLRDDGSLWLNLGDTYENKDLQQIPARVALELQNRGWMLRNRVTWNKPNPMPSSVKDRLNNTTEAIFQFVLNKSYWYDLDAIREPHAEASKERAKMPFDPEIERSGLQEKESVKDANAPRSEKMNHPGGKNPGDVFEVTTKPFPEAHFAVFPPELTEKPIKATCPPKVCANCGTPYERDVERERFNTRPGNDVKYDSDDGHMRNDRGNATRTLHTTEFNGWDKACECDTDTIESGIALDPFAGAGTTLLKAKELGRKFIGIELNPEYADMARGRIGITPENPATLRESENQQGLENYDA